MTLATRTTTPHEGEGSTPWPMLKAELLAARTAHEFNSGRVIAALDAAEAATPVAPEILRDSSGWVILTSTLARESTKSPERLDAILAAGADWWPLREAAYAAQGIGALERAADETWNALSEAVERIVATPAHDLATLLFKLRAALDHQLLVTWRGLSSDDAASVGYLLGESEPAERLAARVYIDVLNLTGSDSPARLAVPFDPAAFVAAFEGEPGYSITGRALTFDLTAIGGEADSSHWDLWLKLPRWQQEAVRQWARDNRGAA